MGWLWSSSDSKAEPQQATPTTIPIRSEPAPSTTTTPTTTPASSSTTASSTDTFTDAFPHLAPSDNPSPTPENQTYDPSLPRNMSCRAAFDAAFYCSSFGGHFNDIYRYGQLRSCSEHWADWRFCMSLTGASPEGRSNAVRERYREKEVKMMEGPNSENVWTRRTEAERIEEPFRLAGEA